MTFFEIFRSLRMSHQTILINFCFLSFTVLLIYGASQVQSAIFFSYVQSFSQTLSQYQEQNMVKIVSIQLRQYIQLKNQIATINLEHFNQLFTSIFNQIEMNNTFNSIFIYQNQFQDCVTEEQINQQIIKYNSDIICQFITNYKYNDFEIISNQTLSFIQQFSMLFNAYEDSKIAYMNLPGAQIFAAFPKSYKYKNFNPKSRPWFKNHMQQYSINPKKDFYFSPIFLSLRNNMPYTTLTYSIKQNETLVGIASQVLPISDDNIKNIPLNLILTNNDGSVIFSTMTSIIKQNESLFFYDELYTGFNSTDWQQLNQILQSNNEASIYLENKIFQKQIYANAYYFQQENITLIIFKNVTFENEYANKQQQLIEGLKENMLEQIYIQIGCCFGLIIISSQIIKVIFTPLLELIEVINMHIRKMGNNLDREIFKMFYKTKKQDDIFSTLTYQFMSLKDIESKNYAGKNKLCLEIEEIKYNMCNEVKDCSKIYEAILLIPQITSNIMPKFIRFDSIQRIKEFKQRIRSEDQSNDNQEKLLIVKQVLKKIYKKQQQQ